MKQTVDINEFRDAFRRYDRYNTFSYGGYAMLLEFLEDMERDTGEELELDVIALCCDFNEESWQDIASNYSIDLSDCEDDEERETAVEEYLQENTLFIGNTGSGLLYQAF